MGRFDFSEEAITDMYKVYQDALNEVHQRTKGIADAFGEYANRFKYEPLIKVSVNALEFYNEDLKRAELSALEEWKSSDLSFTRVMDVMSAGDKAKERGRQLEAQIEQEIQSWQTIDTSGLSGIDTQNWVGDHNDLAEIKQTIDSFTESLTDLQGNYAKTIEAKKTENEIYISIESVVNQSISIVVAGFQSGISESYVAFMSEFSEKERILMQLSHEISQNMSKSADKYVSRGAQDLKSKIREIMG